MQLTTRLRLVVYRFFVVKFSIDHSQPAFNNTVDRRDKVLGAYLEVEARKSDERDLSIEEVRLLIEDDTASTIQNMADTLDIPHTMVQRIATEGLHKKWVNIKWVPHTLSEGNRAVRVERCQEMLASYATRQCT